MSLMRGHSAPVECECNGHEISEIESSLLEHRELVPPVLESEHRRDPRDAVDQRQREKTSHWQPGTLDEGPGQEPYHAKTHQSCSGTPVDCTRVDPVECEGHRPAHGRRHAGFRDDPSSSGSVASIALRVAAGSEGTLHMAARNVFRSSRPSAHEARIA